MNPWTDTLTPAELDARTAATAKLDARFAAEQAKFYAGRTANQLRALAAGAWNCNDAEGYQLAKSYLALAGA